jgi:hypothetical protein
MKKLFCSHDYKLVNQFELKSEYDIVVENGYIPTTLESMRRLIITDYKCTKCSKLKRLKAKTPHI